MTGASSGIGEAFARRLAQCGVDLLIKAVVNVASTAAFQSQPYFAVYAASKAFLLRFGEALWAEQWRSGVRVLTVYAGPVAATLTIRAGVLSRSRSSRSVVSRKGAR